MFLYSEGDPAILIVQVPRALVYASFYYLNIEINKSFHLSNQQLDLLEFFH